LTGAVKVSWVTGMKRACLFETYGDAGSNSQREQGRARVRCKLCAHRCILENGRLGLCKVRKNAGGELVTLNYHKVAAAHSDPIEKKPLYHFLPGTTSFSMAAMGCNFSCEFCQNHSLSVVRDESHISGEAVPPEQLVAAALHYNSRSISYTYSEPTVYFELMADTAKLAKERGLKNVMVTNGYMTAEALDEISPVLDAANIDLKAFRDEFYKKQCGARLAPVLETIKGMKAKGIWIELTTLLIPGLNDDPREVKELISFIVDVDPEIPWHVSRFYPQHRLTGVAPTDPRVIYDFLEMAGDMGLQYRYAGNVASDKWEDTRCPQCDALLIRRSGYSTNIKNMDRGVCTSCGHIIPGVW